MAQIKPTRADYIIAAFGLIAIAVMSIWQAELAAWANVAPKFVVAAGIALSVLIILCLTLLLKKNHGRSHARPAVRMYALALLAAGAAYFFFREEIAEVIRWPIRLGDGLMTFAAVIASVWLSTKTTAKESGEAQ